MSFIDELSSRRVLQQAWERVAAKKGAPGIDRVTVEQFGQRLDANLAGLSEEIGSRKYRPLPVVRIRPAFLSSSDRPLVILSVRDRIAHRAIADLLSPKIEPDLCESCRAFRKGASARKAADDLGRWIEAGEPWVLRADIETFFDSIDRDRLCTMLAPYVDEAGLLFLERVLRCRVFDRDQVSDMVSGIAQGSPLSPLLANLYLSRTDEAMESSHPRYMRYCDDLIVLGPDEDQVKQARDLATECVEALGLSLNARKTRICRVEDGFVFLGYHFGPTGSGPAVKAVEALKCRLDEIADSPTADVSDIDAAYRGWSNYFGDHPNCWTNSLVGILGWLRNGKLPQEADDWQPLLAARWKLASSLTPRLALELARAWSAAGRQEQSWLEMAAFCGGTQAASSEVTAWASLLEVEPSQLQELLRKMVGPAQDRRAFLAEAVAEMGRYELANRISGAAEIASAASSEAEESSQPPRPEEQADIRLLQEWFQGREGVHAVESVNPAGHRSFIPVHRPLSEEDWRAHLAGGKTLGLPLMRSGNTSLIGVLDIDVAKKSIHERLARPDELLGRALGAALRIRSLLKEKGCSSLLEFSGRKGYHLWIRLDSPAPCHRLRRWLLDVVSAAGELPEGIRVEEFPNRDRIAADAVGPLVKLPLGVHSKTGRRCHLLDEEGGALSDPFEAIRCLPKFPAESLPQPAPLAEALPQQAGIGPRAQRMLDGCSVLSFLAQRSQRTAYLNHRERSTLLYTLGHLGAEGAAALHSIISHTYNYSRETTQRHIGRLPEWPISCPKLRELHPQAAAQASCACQFRLSGRAYPSPVLHALRASEISVFRRKPSPGKSTAAASGESAHSANRGNDSATSSQAAEEKVRKIAELKRHRRGIEASIQRLQEELSEVFESSGTESLQLSTGVLTRTRKQDGEGWDFSIEV